MPQADSETSLTRRAIVLASLLSVSVYLVVETILQPL